MALRLPVAGDSASVTLGTADRNNDGSRTIGVFAGRTPVRDGILVLSPEEVAAARFATWGTVSASVFVPFGPEDIHKATFTFYPDDDDVPDDDDYGRIYAAENFFRIPRGELRSQLRQHIPAHTRPYVRAHIARLRTEFGGHFEAVSSAVYFVNNRLYHMVPDPQRNDALGLPGAIETELSDSGCWFEWTLSFTLKDAHEFKAYTLDKEQKARCARRLVYLAAMRAAWNAHGGVILPADQDARSPETALRRALSLRQLCRVRGEDETGMDDEVVEPFARDVVRFL